MAGKSSKGKSKGKGKAELSPGAATVVAKEVQPLASATGLPDLVLKKAPISAPVEEEPAVETPVDDAAEAVAEAPEVESAAAVSEVTDGSEVTSTDEKKSSPDEAGSGNGDADGDGKGFGFDDSWISNSKL